MKYIIDSSLWIEYLDGSKSGEKINEILNEDNEVFTLAPIISEVISKVKRKDGNHEIAYEAIIKNSKFFEITPRISKESGLLHAQKRKKIKNFPLVDAIIICSAKNLKAQVLTQDNHFKSFKEATIL